MRTFYHHHFIISAVITSKGIRVRFLSYLSHFFSLKALTALSWSTRPSSRHLKISQPQWQDRCESPSSARRLNFLWFSVELGCKAAAYNTAIADGVSTSAVTGCSFVVTWKEITIFWVTTAFPTFLCFHLTIVFNHHRRRLDEEEHVHNYNNCFKKKKKRPVLMLCPLVSVFSPSFSSACQCVSALGCGPNYKFNIEEFCLTKFRLDMQNLEQRHWCSWEDTVE